MRGRIACGAASCKNFEELAVKLFFSFTIWKRTKGVIWYFIDVHVRCGDKVSEVKGFFAAGEDVDDLRSGTGIAAEELAPRFEHFKDNEHLVQQIDGMI